MATLHAVPASGGREPGARARARRVGEPLVLLALLLVALLASGWHPKDRRTWLLETAPVLVGVTVLAATYRRFPWSPLSYRLAFGLSLLLLIGGHYHFASVPFGAWIKEELGLRRNDYDRIVHFFGGFVPAILAREFLLRKTPVRNRAWVFFLAAWSCLAGAALYELLEWAAAVTQGARAKDFLATQGDRWDTQWDMFMTFTGAIVSLLILSRFQDRQLARLGSRGAAIKR